ncbi:tRNA (adenosine(37)-N6)-threonylcarbamoyltransferase complex dimerization subunit type 1 TsaB [Poritiphilus flavus]|uniref:tRNA (Adenosine(37)-N6)-threonylcarbamoyltransferase complex dimerization subunit type 1 TsaB n=1 Tax=Poritiphilus flavus TaxID=2697053 RepID=A0A6L9EGI5_9FLAO|nr:tRNA (adenosine(37)-N6)-threonylcarbamoyltransferase complex dimerization subunit type 1 TsaB [Poritiphilus flavus]NAS13801.1 tRNA (adenosine(37)-N6)-threonylcarbamoyltransferase complex dimerization subunit type 1 TsaB [Poritiphilus flavus]
MAKILNLETATTNCSVSLAVDGEIVALKEENTPNYSHSEQLHLFIGAVLKEASLSFPDLDAIAVSKGPGSYTGLRIGVSAAKGLCYAQDIPLIAVPTLLSLAHQVQIEDGFLIPVLDARRMEVYAAVFDPRYNELRSTWAEIISEASFSDYLERGPVHLIGSGAAKSGEVIQNTNLVLHTDVFPSAREMGRISFEAYENRAFEDVAYFEPYYLKDFILTGKGK